MQNSLAIVIPARLESERLPLKPLIKFAGIPMVIRVAQLCAKTLEPENIYVTTPDNEILETCKEYGVQAIKSSMSARSGTDRLVEFAEKYEYSHIVNVQGDELLLTEKCLNKFIFDSRNSTNCTIGVAKISTESEVNKASVVKVAFSGNRLIYASRSAIPSYIYSNSPETYKHTGLYMFTKDSLKHFSYFGEGFLEQIEKVEILRLIENRIPVDIVEVDNYLFTIDTEEDVKLARSILEK